MSSLLFSESNVLGYTVVLDIGRTVSSRSVYLDGKLVHGPLYVDSAVAVSDSNELFTGDSARDICRTESEFRYLRLFDPIPESEYLFGSDGIETAAAIGRFLSDLLELDLEFVLGKEHYRTVVVYTDDFDQEEFDRFRKGADRSNLDPDAELLGSDDLLLSYDELGDGFTMAVEMESECADIAFTDEVDAEVLGFWGKHIQFSED